MHVDMQVWLTACRCEWFVHLYMSLPLTQRLQAPATL